MPGMEADPAREWQRLQEVYSQMSEDELQSVAEEAYGLTDVAKQVLASEIKSRGLNIVLAEDAPGNEEEVPIEDASTEVFDPEDIELVSVHTSWAEGDARTAKNILDEAGIPSYFGPENLKKVSNYKGSYERGVNLKVRAELREGAVRILAQQWPKSDNAAPDPELPDSDIRCPKCHSDEVVLDSAENKDSIEDDAEVFHWHCDACGYKWQDDGVEEEA